MILAEKFSQKLNNLKSKNEIKDFFIYFDEFRSLSLKTLLGAISRDSHPTHYKELSEGEYIIVWNDEKISTGNITTSSVGTFDEFISNAKKSARKSTQKIFIPERGIYPMVRTYSKALADMIDVPEYILKLADILDEIDRMVGFKNGEGDIEIRDGVKYAYSSRNLDEYFSYTSFQLSKTFKNHFKWEIEASDIPSIMSFQELFSFLGDIYNNQVKTKKINLKSGKFDLILAPNLFQKLFQEQILFNLDGDNILSQKSIFSSNDFKEKKKVLGTFSLSYDPLLNQKKGSYRFTKHGLKPQRQYFIKFGKLDYPLLNNINFFDLGYNLPSITVEDFGNLKFEGLKKKSFNDSKKASEKTIFIPDAISISKKDKRSHFIYTPSNVLFEDNKPFSTNKIALNIDLVQVIADGNAELVEFTSGQIGIKLNSHPIIVKNTK